ncbi:MAG: hypothetical protein AVW06_03330 [Hadesarchaea archaeon DG-33-1]|nr:MAG: hypothetical protein AVW06_03330 [Hadesarchaea archaeon DG-33-1]
MKVEIKIAASLIVVAAVVGGITYYLRDEGIIPSAAPSFSVGDVWTWEVTREEIDPETGWTISSDNYSEISKYMGEQNKQNRDCQVFKSLIFGLEEIHVTPGQTFTVHANVYKPENISFPSGGAKLYAGLCDPTNYEVTYNVGGWRNVRFLQWGEEERSENFSLSVTVIDPEYAPKGEDLSLSVLLELSDNSIYADSGIRLSLEAVEIENEKISRHAPGRLVSPGPFDMYYLIAWTNVSIPLGETPHHHYLSYYWTEGDQTYSVMSESFTYGSKIGEFVFDEPALLAEYPLEIGKQFFYNKLFHSTYGAENIFGQDTYSMRVLRKENVTVPAGTFECWVKESTIIRTGTWQDPTRSGEFSSTTTTTRWFSNSVKQAVKEISYMAGTSTMISRGQVVSTLQMERHTEKVLVGYDVEQASP